ncbi:hypothetical protein QVD99_007347 [Batrachochytrium dendrobatidis]|nr:hypothetical protein QVD99_007347 [Batrachochytrium dendrobatidis]
MVQCIGFAPYTLTSRTKYSTQCRAAISKTCRNNHDVFVMLEISSLAIHSNLINENFAIYCLPKSIIGNCVESKFHVAKQTIVAHTSSMSSTLSATPNSEHAAVLERAKKRIKERRELNALLGIASARVQPTHLAHIKHGSTPSTFKIETVLNTSQKAAQESKHEQISPIVSTFTGHEKSPALSNNTSSYRQSLTYDPSTIPWPSKPSSPTTVEARFASIYKSKPSLTKPSSESDALSITKKSSLMMLNDSFSHSSRIETLANAQPKQTESKKSKKGKRRAKKKYEDDQDQEPMKDQDVKQFLEETTVDVVNYVELKKWIPNWKLIIQEEAKMIFYPLTHPFKLPPTWLERIRIPEDEGLYVGTPPYMHASNVKTLCRRLEASEENNGEKWLGSTRQVVIESDPMQYIHYRPHRSVFSVKKMVFETDSNESLFSLNTSNGLYFDRQMPTIVSNQPHQLSQSAAEYLLIVDLVSLKFHEHPLMSEELRLSNEIMNIICIMRERKSANIVEFLTSKLKVLCNEYDEFKLTSPFSDLIARSAETSNIEKHDQKNQSYYDSDNLQTSLSQSNSKDMILSRLRGKGQKEQVRKARIHDETVRYNLLQDIQATRLLRDAEAQTDRLLEFRILKTWQDLKHLRATNNFSSTPLSLKIVVRSTIAHQDKNDLDQEVERELSELQDLHDIAYQRRKRAYEHEFKKQSSFSVLKSNDVSQKISRINIEAKDLAEITFSESPRSSLLNRDQITQEKMLDMNESADNQENSKQKLTAKKDSIIQDRSSMLELPTELKPKKFHAKRLKVGILKRLQASRRPPGSPILSFIQDYSHNTSDSIECSKTEVLRRREVDATYIYLRYFYNDKEVMRTVAKPIDPNSFSIHFNGIEDLSEANQLVKHLPHHAINPTDTKSAFGIKVLEAPRTMRVEVFETGVFGDVFAGEVHVPIPLLNDRAESLDRELRTLQFSGRPFNRDTRELGEHIKEHWISGSLQMSAAWSIYGSCSNTNPPKIQHQQCLDLTNAHGPPGLLNLPRFMEYVVDMKVDPNDPRNGDILKLKALVQSVSGPDDASAISFKEYWKSRNCMRLGLPAWLHRLTLYIGSEYELSNQKRLELLQARYRKEIYMKEPMPISSDDINEDMYQVIDPENVSVRSKSAIVSEINKLSSSAVFPSIDRAFSAGFLKRVRELQLVRKAKLARPISVSDFVREEQLVTSQEQQNPFEMLFALKRPLNPSRVNRTNVATTSPDSCRIVVQVLEGFNLPIRKSTLGYMKNANPKHTGSTIPEYVSPFVEISFQQHKLCTAIANGPNPQWNETIELDVDAPDNDFRPEALCETDIGTEMLYINLFDEILIDMIQDERERATSIHHRKERSWLGSLQIPFSTIWEQIRIDGKFKMSLPAQSLGYTTRTVESINIPGIQAGEEPLLHLFITLDPPLLQPHTLKLRFQSEETPHMLKYSSQWLLALEPFKRVVMSTSLDLQGKTRLICRFIRPQEPPATLPTIAHLRRFVSMIPYLPNRTAFGCECPLISNAQEIIQVGAANGIEHAILLCNFLLARGHDTFVVLGRGIPEGMTAYVMIKQKSDIPAGESCTYPKDGLYSTTPLIVKVENPVEPLRSFSNTKVNVQEWLIIHPVTGEEHNLQDPHIPLKEIGCVFNHENIWANIQPVATPQKTHFCLQDLKNWKPFFGTHFQRDNIKSVQPSRVQFPNVSPGFLADLELAMESAIVSNVEEWRKGRVTRWNR